MSDKFGSSFFCIGQDPLEVAASIRKLTGFETSMATDGADLPRCCRFVPLSLIGPGGVRSTWELKAWIYEDRDNAYEGHPSYFGNAAVS